MTEIKRTDNFSEVSNQEDAYVLKDSSGKQVGTISQKPVGMTEGQTTIYRYKDGTLSAKLPTYMTINKKTGKLTITAPKEVIESSDFKARFGDGSILAQVAKTYKANNDTKITLNDGRSMTVPELLEEWNKGLEEIGEEVKKNIARRDFLSETDERARTFDDNQTRIASYSAVNSGDVKASDTDRQYIPKWALLTEKGKKIANYDSWDEASGTLSRKDALDWWSLGNFTRDEMNELKGKAMVNIHDGTWSDDDYYEADEYDSDGNKTTIKEDNLTSKTEIAKTMSFLRFLLNQDPEGNIFEKAGNIAESTMVNFAMNFSEAATGTLAAIETGAAFITDNLDTWKGLTSLDQAMKDSTAYYNDAMSMASDAAVAVGQIAGVGGQILGHVYVGKVFSLTGELVGAGASSISGARLARNIDAATQPLTTLAGTLFEGGAIGMAEYSQMASALAAGSKFMTTALATGGKIGAVFNQAITIARNIKETPLVGTSISFLADTLVDATISNPEAMRVLLTDIRKGNVSAEDVAFAREQFIQNAQGWAIFRAAGLGLKGVLTKTTLGKAANLKISQFLTSIDNWAYDKDQAIKTKILGKTVIESLEDQLSKSTVGSAQFRRIQNKLSVAQNNKILRDFKETFASGKNWDTVLDKMVEKKMIKENADLKGIKKYVHDATIIQNNIKAWNNAIDNMQRGVMRENIAMLNKDQNPFTAETNDALVDWDGDLAKLEGRRKGLTYDEKHTSMSLEASNYMGYTQTRERAVVMANDEKLPESRRNKAIKYIDHCDAQIEALKEALGPDIVTHLDRGLELYRNEYAALNEYASKKGYINSVEQAELDDMELWETGYVRTQRVMDDSGIVMSNETGSRKTRSSIDTEHYTFGKKDFADFEQTRAQYRNRIAEVAYQKKLLDVYMLNGNATVKKFISTEDTERVRKLSKMRADYKEAIATVTDKASASFASRRSRGEKKLTDSEYQITMYGLSYDESQAILQNYGYIEEWRGESLVDGFTGQSIVELSPEQKEKYWQDFTFGLNTSAADFLLSKGIANIDDLNRVVSEEGTEFVAELNRAYLMGDKSLRNAEFIKKLANNKYENKVDFVKDVKVASTKEALKYMGPKLGDGGAGSVVNGFVDYSEGWINDVLASANDEWAITKTSQERATMIGSEEAITREYSMLEELSDNKKYRQSAYEHIDEQLKIKYGNAITDNEMDQLKDEAHKVFDATLENRLDTAKSSLLETATEDNLRRDVFDEVKELKDKIENADKRISRSVNKTGVTDCIILSTDDKGRKIYYEVDPVLASIYNKRQNLSAREASGVAKVNYAMSKMFRLGTTTVNLTSYGNQFFKDTGNAIIVGGMWDTFKNNKEAFRDVFGKDVLEQIESYDPYEQKIISKIATDNGLSPEEAVLKYETGRASRIADESSEVALYKSFRETAYGGDTEYMERYREALASGQSADEARKFASSGSSLRVLEKMDNNVQKGIEWIDSHVNGTRERYLRKNVYMSNLNDYLKNGYSISQARTAAEFAARNATTNFGRTLYHLQNISESTPYFAAAINGTKSFWRMFELDPVGITGRFVGGLVLPVMYLTALSLSNEEDAKLYKNLPEYARSGNLTFVTNGQVFNIPLPEQLADLVNPFRHFVEFSHDANKASFWKLAANDLLGVSPIDLQGFSSVDFNDISRDPDVLDLMGRGFSRLFSQCAPVAVKTAYMGFTGIDPYTGKKLGGVTRFFYDDKTESIQMMDYTQNMFARKVASMFGSDNPAIIEKVTSSLFGNTGSDVLGVIFGIFAAKDGKDPYSGEDYNFGNLAEGVAEQVASRALAPVTGPDYDQVMSMWNQAIREAGEKKAAILSNKRVQAIQQELSQEKDPEKRKKLIAERQSYKDEFDQEIKTMVERLTGKYGGTLDRHKLASIMQLLNFDTDTGWATATSYSQQLHSDLFYEGRNQAIQSLVDMGITGAGDTSVFGYYTTTRDGEVVLKYNDPLTILNAKNSWYNRRDIDSAAVKYTLETSIPNLNNERSDMWARVKAAKGNNAKDAIREEWNEKILGGIMPYIADLTTEQILDNDAVVNYLEGYIQVPSWYEKVNNRYVSSGYDAKTGTYKLDKNKAFVESYLRTVLEKR